MDQVGVEKSGQTDFVQHTDSIREVRVDQRITHRRCQADFDSSGGLELEHNAAEFGHVHVLARKRVRDLRVIAEHTARIADVGALDVQPLGHRVAFRVIVLHRAAPEREVRARAQVLAEPRVVDVDEVDDLLHATQS